MPTSITRNGITIEIAETCTVRLSVTGDPLIVAPGGFTVTNITPGPYGVGPAQLAGPGAGTGGARNGCMINPTVFQFHGFDGRINTYTNDINGNFGWGDSGYYDQYNAAIAGGAVTYPFTVPANGSLICSLSGPEAIFYTWTNGTSSHPLVEGERPYTNQEKQWVVERYAFFTAISIDPGADYIACRPPPTGTWKPLYTIYDVDLTKLPNLTSPYTFGNNWQVDADKERYCKRGWWFWCFPSSTMTDRLSAQYNQWGYPGTAAANSHLGFSAKAPFYTLFDYPDRDEIAYRVIQWGLDCWATQKIYFPRSMISAAAGYDGGRWLPIVYAGHLLGDEDMVMIANNLRAKWTWNGQRVFLADKLTQTYRSRNALWEGNSPNGVYYTYPLHRSMYMPDGPPLYGDWTNVPPADGWNDPARPTVGAYGQNHAARDPDGKYNGDALTPQILDWVIGPDNLPVCDPNSHSNANAAGYMRCCSSFAFPTQAIVIRALGLHRAVPKHKDCGYLEYADLHGNDKKVWNSFPAWEMGYLADVYGYCGWGDGWQGNTYRWLRPQLDGGFPQEKRRFVINLGA
jgi:hypothetical protein